MDKKIIMGIGAVILVLVSCCCICIAYFGIFNTSFLGSGCLYDDGSGFTEMNNGEEIELDNGQVVRCDNGKVIFE